MAKVYLIIGFLVMTGCLRAQQIFGDSALFVRAINDAKNRYDMQMAGESAIYNGIRVYPYPPEIEGTAFFQSPDFQKATIVYGDVMYNNISMKYDLVKDEVVVSPEDKTWLLISLFSPRVSEFSFGTYKFVHLRQSDNLSSLTNGFYEVIAEGKVTAFVRHKKSIYKKVVDNYLYQRFDEKIRYYLLKTGVYFSVRNANDLFDVVREHKKEVKQFLSQNKLKFRRNPGKTIYAAVELYNRLEN